MPLTPFSVIPIISQIKNTLLPSPDGNTIPSKILAISATFPVVDNRYGTQYDLVVEFGSDSYKLINPRIGNILVQGNFSQAMSDSLAEIVIQQTFNTETYQKWAAVGIVVAVVGLAATIAIANWEEQRDLAALDLNQDNFNAQCRATAAANTANAYAQAENSCPPSTRIDSNGRVCTKEPRMMHNTTGSCASGVHYVGCTERYQ